MQHACQRPQQRGLAQSRHAFQQNVTAREQANQDAVHHIMLADDDFSDLLPDLIQLRGGNLEGGIGGHYPILLTFEHHDRAVIIAAQVQVDSMPH